MFHLQPTPCGAPFGGYGLGDGFVGGGFPVQGVQGVQGVHGVQDSHPSQAHGFAGSGAECGCGGSPAGGQQLQAFGQLQQAHSQHHHQQLLALGQVPPPPAFHTNHHQHQHHPHYQSHPNHHHHHHHNHHPQNHHQQHHHPNHDPTSPPHTVATMEAASPQDDVVAQEAAARDYQPQLEGPLVGDRITSHAITEQYAKADPVYVEKTIALPQTYSHYRPIQGDGNCGWRAIGFSYFETLILTATPAKIAAEIARLAELDQYIENVGGFQRFLWEDMAEETMLILADIQANLANPDVAIASLQAKFNDDGVSNAVIYHLRLLAASYLKGNVDNYEPFIGGSAKEYSSGTIEPANREIEHIGIILLVEVLLRPADFVLEIVYLDRTPMSKANTYRFPEEHNARPESELGPTIHLLYRPDHYDILYKPPPTPVDVQVHRAADFTHQFQIAPANIAPCGPLEPEVDFELLLAMNSYSAAAGNPLASMLPFDLGPATTAYSPSPEAQPPQSWGEPPCSEPLPVRHTPAASASPTRSIITPHTQHQPRSQSQSPRMQQQPEHQQQQAPEHVQSVMPVAPSPIVTTHPLRFSRYSFPTKTAEGVSEVKSVDGQAMALAAVTEHHPMATEAFRNSHFNVAHFNNPNFQPEEYRRPHAGERRRSADDDASEGGTTRRKKKEKSIKAEPKEDV
ncbi:ubiquitin thioesterase [Gaeumannomyces tritici R3-111a-1]|uniref:ubiquitinyl hydrolase 1 n=1 Tax=Gaeumannomyces tritici (strain R3-111a-1) TaxID=644352 RepID=J3PF18_GAET3|nr:ubiquitin thioesterase [Gaeumannomyces tritici R3-111a-1]EJT71076.1 ubiquitin thioesterase [Gaeumannomyces tritici R3-111a-1]